MNTHTNSSTNRADKPLIRKDIEKLLQEPVGSGRLDLRKQNLTRIDLTQLDLTRVDLREANLSDANLSDANLSRALLGEADLSDANLSGTNLNGCNLSGTNLSRANLNGANLNGATLSRAILKGADLSIATLIGAYLGDADLSGACMRLTDLSGAKLDRVNLSGADLSGAILSGTNLTEIDLSKTTLGMATINEAESKSREEYLKRRRVIELEARLNTLNHELSMAGLSQGLRMALAAGLSGLITIIIAFIGFVIALSSSTGKGVQFISGWQIVAIIGIFVAGLIIYFAFVFGRRARIKAEISQTIKQLEIEAGEKV